MTGFERCQGRLCVSRFKANGVLYSHTDTDQPVGRASANVSEREIH